MLNLRASKVTWFVVIDALLSVVYLQPNAAIAQPGPDGIDWVTIGAPGNRAYDREDPVGLITGRGSVPYEYRIGRFEVTSAQWMEFYNVFKAREDAVPNSTLPVPTLWGAGVDPTYTGPGTRYRLDPSDPNAGMRFTAGVSWRAGAMFANWLHNDKRTDLSAIQNGAYDTSTFGELRQGEYTDQIAHNPGARYWIPTLDEWAKASFYDENANGGQGGWWLYPFGSDTRPIYAPPPSWGGNGQANTFFQLPGMAQFRIPLGAYADTGAVTPWGMLDSAGATSEWLEERLVGGAGGYQVFRYIGGSSSAAGQVDLAYLYGDDSPTQRAPWIGLRLASAVPGPGSFVILTGTLCWGAVHRSRRRLTCKGISSS